jgi:hypothetical protein
MHHFSQHFFLKQDKYSIQNYGIVESLKNIVHLVSASLSADVHNPTEMDIC